MSNLNLTTYANAVTSDVNMTLLEAIACSKIAGVKRSSLRVQGGNTTLNEIQQLQSFLRKELGDLVEVLQFTKKEGLVNVRTKHYIQDPNEWERIHQTMRSNVLKGTQEIGERGQWSWNILDYNIPQGMDSKPIIKEPRNEIQTATGPIPKVLKEPTVEPIHQQTENKQRETTETNPMPNTDPMIPSLVPLTALVESPFQFRSTYDERKIGELRDSIKEVGLLQPLVVRENGIGALEIVAGHRRFKALQKAGVEKAFVIKRKMTDEEAIFTQLAENIQREDASDYDIGKALHKLTDKYSQQEIGAKIGISQQQVSNYIEHYRFCENNITTAVVNVDVSELTEYSTRPLRKLEKTDKIQKNFKELKIKPNSKLTVQDLKTVYKNVYREIPDQLPTDVKEFLSEHPNLYSLVSYPSRGPFGSGEFPGNASGWLLVELINHFKPKVVFDPMEGSHTSKHVCQGMQVVYFGNDLKNEDGYDVVECSTEQIPNNDLTYFHPPYWNIIKYSDHPNDLSNQATYDDFLEKLCICVDKLLKRTKILTLLIGDIWKGGNRFLAFDIYGRYKKQILQRLIKAQHSVGSGFADKTIKEKEPFFIPIRHEDIILLKGDNYEAF